MGVDSDGWASHSCPHDRDRFIAVKTGVTEHISCSVELLCACKEVISDKFRAERITRK